MTDYVVDTNVPIVANGRSSPKDKRVASIDCRIEAIEFLRDVLKSGRVLVDVAGEIQREYHGHLNPSGQPGVGDRFYLEVLNSAPRRIARIDLPKTEDGEFVDCPRELIEANFDRSDRKFVALARRGKAPVVNATDSDWLEHGELLEAQGVRVEFLCGCDRSSWFTEP
jgi:hypothetical protein